MVDPVHRPDSIFITRPYPRIARQECPVLLPFRTRCDPLLQGLDFLWFQGVALGRHPLVRIGMSNACDYFAVLRLTRNDGNRTGLGGCEQGPIIGESESARLLHSAMTAGTLSTENWQNIATKINLGTNRKDHYQNGGQAKKRWYFWEIHGRQTCELLIFCVGLQDPVAKGTDSTRIGGAFDVLRCELRPHPM